MVEPGISAIFIDNEAYMSVMTYHDIPSAIGIVTSDISKFSTNKKHDYHTCPSSIMTSDDICHIIGLDAR